MSEAETVDHWSDKKKPEVQRGPKTGDRGGYSRAQSRESMLWEGRNVHKGLLLLLQYPISLSSLAFTCSTLSLLKGLSSPTEPSFLWRERRSLFKSLLLRA